MLGQDVAQNELKSVLEHVRRCTFRANRTRAFFLDSCHIAFRDLLAVGAFEVN